MVQILCRLFSTKYLFDRRWMFAAFREGSKRALDTWAGRCTFSAQSSLRYNHIMPKVFALQLSRVIVS